MKKVIIGLFLVAASSCSTLTTSQKKHITEYHEAILKLKPFPNYLKYSRLKIEHNITFLENINGSPQDVASIVKNDFLNYFQQVLVEYNQLKDSGDIYHYVNSYFKKVQGNRVSSTLQKSFFYIESALPVSGLGKVYADINKEYNKRQLKKIIQKHILDGNNYIVPFADKIDKSLSDYVSKQLIPLRGKTEEAYVSFLKRIPRDQRSSYQYYNQYNPIYRKAMTRIELTIVLAELIRKSTNFLAKGFVELKEIIDDDSLTKGEKRQRALQLKEVDAFIRSVDQLEEMWELIKQVDKDEKTV